MVAAEILGPDIEICAFAMGEGQKKKKKEKKTQSMSLPKLKAAQSFQNKRREGRFHQSFLLTTGRCCSGRQHGRDLSAQPMCFLITLLISRQTKFRSSSIFSLLKNISHIYFLHFNCTLRLPVISCGDWRCSRTLGHRLDMRTLQAGS